VIFYELLTDTLPFPALTTAGYLVQLSTRGAPPSPRRERPSLPRDLAVICRKCLERRPEDRYESAASLADDLRRFIDGRPILTQRPSVLERARRWARNKLLTLVRA
jgi:serine/threonine-protein kinase